MLLAEVLTLSYALRHREQVDGPERGRNPLPTAALVGASFPLTCRFGDLEALIASAPVGGPPRLKARPNRALDEDGSVARPRIRDREQERAVLYWPRGRPG